MSVLEMERGLSLSPAMPEAAATPETGTGQVFEVMGEGYVIENEPTPIATIVAGSAASAEAVMVKIAELSDRMDDSGLKAGERFRPLTLADLKAELESIEVADKPETDASFIEELLESDSLIRPRTEDEADSGGAVGNKEPERSRNFMLGLRRSRLGKALATTTLVAAGALSWASSSSAASLKDICAPSIFKKGTVKESEMHNPGKNNQDIIINIHVDDVDPQCDGAFKRVVFVRPQIKHKGQQKWINEDIWTPIYNGDTSAANDIGGVFFNNPLRQPSRYYTKGSHVRFQEKIQEKNEANGKIAGTRISLHTVAVID